MPRYVIYTRLSRSELKARLAQLPRILSGHVTDSLGIARGFKLRLAVAWLSKIKQAFIVKARGGTDECGISWPPLSPKYLAYGRGPKSTRTAGKHSPGGKDGFMSKTQLAAWRKIYARNLAWLAVDLPLVESKARAAQIAWAAMKRQGVKTKLQVFGSRVVEILRDRGLLFNSLSPGILSERGPDASYSPPDGQALIDNPGELLVGTNVDYAKYHQGDDEQPGRRRIWPRADEIPASWLEDFSETAASGIPVAIQMIARGAA
ncbi:MAG: hypothetical protein AB7I37_25310 [Pirellulales bacterium]